MCAAGVNGGVVPKPSACGKSCGGLIARRPEGDAWYCTRCGWDKYDSPGQPRPEGALPREQVYPIGTGKYSGH